jgi:hypothetical protein
VPIWQFSVRPAVPEYCRCTPGRPHALLDEPGLIHDQHRVTIAELLHHIIAQVVAQHVGVPACPAQQPLHRVRRGITGELGQRPPVLALQPGQQTTHISHGLAAWLDPPEPVPHPHTQLIQPGSPRLNVDAHPAKPAVTPRSSLKNHKRPLQY